MDPDACLANAEAALAESPPDFELAGQFFQSLNDWVLSGGFLPEKWQESHECYRAGYKQGMMDS